MFVQRLDVTFALCVRGYLFLVVGRVCRRVLRFFFVLDDPFFPEAHYFPAPDEHHARFLVSRMLPALIFKFTHIEELLIVLFAYLNHFIHFSVADLHVTGVLVHTD